MVYWDIISKDCLLIVMATAIYHNAAIVLDGKPKNDPNQVILYNLFYNFKYSLIKNFVIHFLWMEKTPFFSDLLHLLNLFSNFMIRAPPQITPHFSAQI